MVKIPVPPINYEFQVVTSTVTTTALTLGNDVTSTISEPGEQDIYTFSGTSGQRLFYDALITGTFSINAELLSPSGERVFFINSSNDINVINLTETGTYQLIIDGNGDTTGDYSFRLSDMATAALLEFDTSITGELIPGLETDLFRFIGVQGQQLFFDGISGSSAFWSLLGPGGQLITNNLLTSNFEVELPGDGEYVLVLDGNNSSAPINYEFQVITPETTIMPLPTQSELAFSTANFSINEDGTPVVAVTVTRSGTISGAVSADITFTDDTATAPADYDNTVITVNFADGEFAPQPIIIPIVNDIMVEGSETFSLALGNVIGPAVLGAQSTATVTILDDDVATPGTLEFDAATFSINEDGTPVSAVTVTRSGGSDGEVSAEIAFTNGTATAPEDYNANTPIVVTFADGEDGSQTFPITVVNNETLFEDDETINLTLGNVMGGATLGTQDTATLTVVNDDPLPTISIFNTSQNEGDSSTTPFTFFVDLSNPSEEAITVEYTTDDGTATLADGDYVDNDGTLIFAPGTISQTITVDVNGDETFEGNETFFVNLGTATNATVSVQNGQGTGTILGDDVIPTVSISPSVLTLNEGNSGTTAYTFTVFLSNITDEVVTVDYITDDGSATTLNNDYLDNDGTLTFNPGDFSQTITVDINGDATLEGDEDFFVRFIGATNGTISSIQNESRGVISEDDIIPTVSISPSTVTQAEGDSGITTFTFNVTLSNPTAQTVTVSYTTDDGTATLADNDYVDNDGDLTFNPGETFNTITVDVNGDTNVEFDETFTVNLTGATNANLGVISATGGITNDDVFPTISDNQSILASINFVGDEDAYTFAAEVGDLVEAFVDNLTDSGPQRVRIRLVDVDGMTLLDSDDSNAPNDDVEISDPTLPFQLTQDGTYTLLVDGVGDTTGDYTIGLTNFTEGALSITDNTSNSDTFTFAGDGEAYTFDANAGDLVEAFVDNLTNSGPQRVRIRLVDVDGMTLLDSDDSNAPNDDVEISDPTLPFQLTQDGTYTLLVDGVGDTTGDYTIGLTNFTEGALSITDNTSNSDTFTFAGDGEAYTFDANAGDLVEAFVDNLTNSGPQRVRIRLVDVDGMTLLDSDDSNAPNDDVEISDPTLPFQLTQDGTYTLLVDGVGDTTGDYTIGLTNFTEGALSITDNTSNSDTFTFAGDGEAYTFDANAGDLVEAFVDNLTNSGPQRVRIRLVDVDGMTLLDSDDSNAPNDDVSVGDDTPLPFQIAQSGTYTLLVDGVGDTSGDYTIGLTNFTENAQTLAGNQNITDTLEFAGDGEAYTFDAQAGDRFTVFADNLTDSGLRRIRLRLLDIDGTTVLTSDSSNSAGDDVEINDFELTNTGTYTLLFDGIGDTAGGYTINPDFFTPTLTLAITPDSISENGGTATATLTRNTGTSGDLVVDLSSDDTTEATVPTQVTIADGSGSAQFTVTGVDDLLADGNQTVTISASAPGLAPGSDILEITDDETAALSLIIDADSIAENGGSTTATVTRNSGTTGDLVVNLSSDDSTEATVPSSVVIPNGQNSATFTVTAVDDDTNDATQTVTITASALGFTAAMDTVDVTDDELPILRLVIDEVTISENGGTATGTVIRVGTNGDLDVNLTSDDIGEATVPAIVTIPDGETFVEFTITGIDDAIVDGPQTVIIDANAPGFIGDSESLLITDDDNPSLDLVIEPASISENGGTATATLFRNTGISGDLVVDLSSSDITEAMVPAQVTIPDSQELVQFTITAIDDLIVDGDQSVTIIATAPGLNDASATLSVDDDDNPALSLTIDADNIPEGATTTATVTRNTGTTGDLIVNLVSDDTSEASVPAIVTIPDGEASVTFTINSINDAIADGNQTVNITASATSFSDGIDSLNVTDDETPGLTLAITPDSISENGGTATATLTRNTGTSGDLVVNLSSDDTTEATVPAQVTIADGSDSVQFTVTGVDDLIADGDQSVTVTASATGFSDVTDTLTVTDDETPGLTLTINPDSISENGGTAIGIVTRNTGTSGDLVVDLSSDDLTEATVPTQVTIADGSDSVQFAVTGVDDLFADGNQSVTVTVSAAGFSDVTDTLTVTDDETPGLTLTINPDSISENGGTAIGIVTRNTGTSGDLVVDLSSDDLTEATVPTQVTIADGSDSVQFAVTGVDDLIADGDQSVTITASAAGFSDVTDTLTVTDDEAPELTLTIDPDSISENGGIATATLTRNTGTSGDLVVNLSSDDTTEATVPTQATIADGSDSVQFTVTGVDDLIADGDQSVTITASATGFSDVTDTLTVTDDEAPELTLTIDPDSISENGGTATATLTRNTGTSGDLVVDLSSDDLTEATVPTQVIIADGSDSVQFTVTGVDDLIADGDQSVTVTASATGFSDVTDTLTVTDDEAPELTLTIDPDSISENGGDSHCHLDAQYRHEW